ncbi:MAG: hypothetical protein QM657_08765 [Lacrimispora sp.]|uniref:hypothetical protein n=1 Tax=Lacrimispora sp. TaxID=2719234 RepID=UPI0039E42629
MSKKNKLQKKQMKVQAIPASDFLVEDNNFHNSLGEKLNALITLYGQIQEEIRFRQKRGDDAVYPAYTMLIAALGIQSLQNILDINMITILLALIIPIIALTGVQRGHQEHKMLASARGYSSYLEHQINLLCKEKFALWNSGYIEKYIASMKVISSKKLKTSQLLTFISSIAPVVLSTPIAFRTLYNLYIADKDTFWTSLNFIIALGVMLIIYVVIMLILIWNECIKFTQNEIIRRESAIFPQELKEKPFPFHFE